MNCDMYHVETAGYDTVFYLHHAYVDRQFTFWQELQRLRGSLRGFDSPKLARHLVALRPFDNRQFNDKQKTLENNLGSDTWHYKTNYCYVYDNLTFMGMTPQDFWNEERVVRMEFSCRHGVCSQVAKVYVLVGVILPKKAPSGIHTFELCLGSKCIPAGQVATFGAGSSTSSKRVDTNTHKVVEYDVTDLVNSARWLYENVDRLTSRLTSNVVEGLPGPIVIKRARVSSGGGSGGQVRLPGGHRLEDYGNLLEKYDIV